MNLIKIVLIILLSSIGYWAMAQETAIYRDNQKTYKRGRHFYKKHLYGKALEAFDKVVAQKHRFTDTDVPMYMLQAELHAGLSALYLDQPDAEKRLLSFIDHHEPTPIATKARMAIGDYYYNKREYDKAIAYLSKITESALSNDEIIAVKFKVGYCYFVKKKFRKAQAYFSQTKNAKTQYFYPSNYYDGICSFFLKNYNEALKSFEKAKRSKRYSRVVPVYLCQIYFAKKDYDKAIKYGEPIVDDNSVRERKKVEQLLGQAYFEKGMYNKALPRLENYVRSSPKVTKESMYQLAYTQYKVEKYKAAIDNFKQLNSLKNSMGQNALYNMADCLLKSGDKSAARQAFEQASKLSYDKALQEDALINYAKLSYELRFDNEAINALKQFDSGSDYYNEAQNLMSEVFLNTRDYDNALETIRKLNPSEIKLKETWQKIAYFRGLQYFGDKDYANAAKLFNESLKRPINNETKALAYFWRAECKFKTEKYEPSIKDYLNFESAAKAAPQLPANSSMGVGYYGLGYSYIKMDKYSSAARYFRSCVNEIKPKLNQINDRYVTNFVYPDALLRAGDCYIYLRRYNDANYYYNIVINNKYPNQDYAMFQQSLIKNLQKKPFEQIALLDKIVDNYPSSLYADDALYSKGNALFNMGKKTLAIETYEYMIKEYPVSEKVNRAYLKLGLISYQLGRNEEALNYYKGVIQTDPQSEDAQDALAAIKEIYITTGNPDGYFNFVNTVQGYQIKDFERDSLMYRSAEIKFENHDLEGAVTSFTSYLNRFPDGINNIKARFYRAEALFDLKRYDEALRDYAYISDKGNPTYAETANHRAANITYYNEQARDFAAAEKYFGRLEKIATSPELLFEAQQLGMRSAFYANNFSTLAQKADKLMNNPRATPADHAEANYFKGKAYVAQKNYGPALEAFNKNIELSGDDVHAAEARYWRAYITYANRDLDRAMELCLNMNKEVPNHTYWVVKAFILVADIYAEKDNLFQAKATLQSIIDNYNGDQELLDEAKQKLQNVIDAEKGKSKIKEEDPDGLMEMIEE